MSPEDFESQLREFSGSEQFYRHGLLRSVVYTDGVRFMAESAGALWLIDAIASHQLNPRVAAEEFQAWKLQRNDDGTWTLRCEDGNDNEVCAQQIDWSDFPLASIELWFTNSTLLLPSEY
jgi:hypothetical protein